jgi:two-component system chemotaxis response regulator CheB
MHGRDIIVLGASAGGVETLCRLVEGLPANLPAALFVVCHFPAHRTSQLPTILSRHGPLPAGHARNGEPIRPGRIYVACPDYHMVLDRDRVYLDHGPRENRHRPAIDPLFRTAAQAYGPRVVGVVLSGLLGDGSAGLMAVRSSGGVGIIQDPADAFAAAMPRTAWEVAGADYVLPITKIAPQLVRLAMEPIPHSGGTAMPDPLEEMPQRVHADMTEQQEDGRSGQVSLYTCPECGGVMWQVPERAPPRFRCHVGHSYYGESLLEEQSQALEAALWTAVRTFKEKCILARQLARQARHLGEIRAAERFEEDSQLAERYGRLIQENVLKGNVHPPVTASGPDPLPPDPGAAGPNAAPTPDRES